VTRMWFDPLTPKQALFCKEIGERFEAADFEVVYTSRDYSQVTEKLDLLGIKAQILGKHGGGDRYEKLRASGERIVALAKYINSVKPDLAFSFASPEGARVAYGLGIPFFTANDSPHSRFVAQLTIPYAINLFTPWIMEAAWVKSYFPQQKIIPYHGLDPVAWLQDFAPNPKALSDFGLEVNSKFVVVRSEEGQASYLEGRVNELSPITIPVIKAIQEQYSELHVVVLCRYSEQRQAMSNLFGDSIILPEGIVDATSLIASAQLVVGAGGTMNQEASLLGVPVISCFPGNHLITDQFLAKKQLLYRLTDPDAMAKKAIEILHNHSQYEAEHRKRAQKLMKQMENPVDVIYSHIMTYFKKELKKE
jgi:predicted glycosyltransferase